MIKSSNSPCCRTIPVDAVVSSPFNRLVVFQIYDGPTQGVALCDICETPYRFMMLDWNKAHIVRVFALSELPADSLGRILSYFSEAPRWPVWLPSGLRMPTSQALDRFDKEIQPILDMASPASFVSAWSRDLRAGLAAKRIERSHLGEVQDWFSVANPNDIYDWFAFLGLAK